jgi:phage tail protein X
VALVLDRIGEAVAKCEPRRDPAPVDAKALAYLMPDQDLATRRVTHGELVDWVMRRRQARGPGAHLRAFHAAAPCSDAGVTELWPPLAAGALVTLTEASREPTTAVERRLAEIVAHVLDLDRCDLDQDLVPLWEDEALTAKAVLMIRAGLGVEPTAHDLAGAPTLADLAGGIEARLNTAEVDGVLRA